MNYLIKDILKRKGIKVEDFAAEIGIKRETLSRIINGASTTTDTLDKIAQKLGVHITELYDHSHSDGVFTCPKCGASFKMVE